ncbi:hypothetical protein CB1_000533042 [Camelus ferus]|nr:hypothetical protein CB1_000533042 [Camelus ferus]
MNSPKSKKPPKKEEPSQDDIISPKTKSAKKSKEPFEESVVSPKTKKVVKAEEPSEEEMGAPKPKKMKKEKEMNGEIGEKSPKLKNGFPHSGPDSSSKEAASEESNSELEQEIPVEQKEGAFSNFPISEETIKLLKARGVTFLFPIQAKTFHHVYSGKDLIAQARTGTGKTFSFAIPLIEKLQGELQDRKRGRAPQVLVLAPTRELASQVSRDFSDITKKLAVACFYGGTPYGGQIERMRNGIDILVGTPGRIKDHLQNGKLNLTNLKHVVLDEVDQMLDMGFADQVEEILCVAYKKDSEDNPQTLLFSATCPHWVFNVAKKYMKSTYEQVDLIGKKTQKTAITVEHLAIKCHWTQRAAVIGDVIRVYSGYQGRTIIFCETKKEAQELSQNAAVRQDAQSLHGDIPQKQREITLKGFRNGDFGVLVATNVAARGLDIPEVDLVVQSCPPKGIKFKRIGVPSATEIIKASSKDAIRLLDSVPPTAVGHFKQSAEKLIEEKGAVEALAAALAHISGATSVDQRSLINSDVGFVTMILQCSIEMPNISYAWKELKEQLGEDIDSKVKGMVFLKGKQCAGLSEAVSEVSQSRRKAGVPTANIETEAGEAAMADAPCVEIREKFQAALALSRVELHKNPEKEPYKSKYGARALLEEVKALLGPAPEDEEERPQAEDSLGAGDHTLGLPAELVEAEGPIAQRAVRRAVIEFHLGVNHIDTEELSAGEEHLVKCLRLLRKYRLSQDCVSLYIQAQVRASPAFCCSPEARGWRGAPTLANTKGKRSKAQFVPTFSKLRDKRLPNSLSTLITHSANISCCFALSCQRICLSRTSYINNLGILWSEREEIETAQAYLESSEALYNQYMKEIGSPPLDPTEHFLPEEEKLAEQERSKRFEKVYTHNLYYLAQVYQHLEMFEKAAHYCHSTLKRQLEHNAYHPMEWAINAATLSQFYINKAGRGLSCLYSYIRFSSDSRRPVSSLTIISFFLPFFQDNIGELDLDKQSELRALRKKELDEEESVRKKAVQFGTGELCDAISAVEEKVSYLRPLDFEEARELFLTGQHYVFEAKEFFQIDGYVTDHIEVVQDHSALFKVLAFFETDMERRCKMHKRRIAMLEPLIVDLNPQYYLLVNRQIQFEIAHAYYDMMDLKVAIADKLRDPDSHIVKKINNLNKSALKYYQLFLDSLRDPNKVFPEHIGEDVLRPAMLAKFRVARLYGKIITADPKKELENLATSLEHYKFIVDYCEKHPEAAQEIEVELELSKEMKLCNTEETFFFAFSETGPIPL